jgi:hypothetical protein
VAPRGWVWARTSTAPRALIVDDSSIALRIDLGALHPGECADFLDRLRAAVDALIADVAWPSGSEPVQQIPPPPYADGGGDA